jgi:hypothetical protein
MSMSRKHYREVAELIKSQVDEMYSTFVNDDEIGTGQAILFNITSGLATLFKIDNSQFDRQKFMDACGIDW